MLSKLYRMAGMSREFINPDSRSLSLTLSPPPSLQARMKYQNVVNENKRQSNKSFEFINLSEMFIKSCQLCLS